MGSRRGEKFITVVLYSSLLWDLCSSCQAWNSSFILLRRILDCIFHLIYLSHATRYSSYKMYTLVMNGSRIEYVLFHKTHRKKISLKSIMTVSGQKVYKRILDSLMSSVHCRIQGEQYEYGQVCAAEELR